MRGLLILISCCFISSELHSSYFSFCKHLFQRKHVQNNDNWRQEIVNLDREIKQLIYRKNLHLSRSEQLDLEGDRLQTYPDRLTDARIAWKRADQERVKARNIQGEIYRLQKRKLELLEEHKGE